jgi:hypothetical protein
MLELEKKVTELTKEPAALMNSTTQTGPDLRVVRVQQ